MPNLDNSPKTIDSKEWNNLFPRIKELPADGIFELGLVLGGTVSAGAYSAGVLDFLVEALDNWDAQKAHQGTPDWHVVIKAVTGTSGGGVLAATLAKALSFDFKPVSSLPINEAAENPFYNVWVERLDISYFLSTSDLDRPGPVQSLLNSDCRFKAGDYVAQFGSSGNMPQKNRAYVAEPLPVFLTLSNLTGIPHKVEWGNGLSQSYVEHADYVRLAIFTQGGSAPIRPDEFGVSTNPGVSGFISWTDATQFAMGTSAFPVGLPYQPLSRPVSHYSYRPIIDAGDGNKIQATINQPSIDWNVFSTADANILSNGNYHFLAADGGVFNNEPIELCRTELAGVLGRNDRNGDQAKRAILLIDPFAEAPSLGGPAFANLGKSTVDLLTGLKNQARYDTQDISLACNPDCYSRFMITARRNELVGGKAIATASLGAFGGFLCQKYREHDYFLGRKNCHDFLNSVNDGLWLPETNPVFTAWRKSDPISAKGLRQKNTNGIYCLPLIPLFGSSSLLPMVPAYPEGAFDPHSNKFQALLTARIEKLLERVSDELVSNLLIQFLLEVGEKIIVKTKIIELITQKIQSGLKEWAL